MFCLLTFAQHRYGLTNFVHEWGTDFNEDQCIITTGECGSGKTETSRMVVHFLTNVAEFKRTKLSSSLLKLCRQQRMGRTSSTSSNPNSRNTTPKHQQLGSLSNTGTISSCMKSSHGGAVKKCSHEKVVEFDFSHRRSSENLQVKCTKHGVQANIHFSKSFEESMSGNKQQQQMANQKACTKHICHHNPSIKQCDSSTNTDKDTVFSSTSTLPLPEGRNTKFSAMYDNTGSRLTNSIGEYSVPKHQYHHCNCLDAKSNQDKKHWVYDTTRSRSNEAIPEKFNALDGGTCSRKDSREMWKMLRNTCKESRYGIYVDDPFDLHRVRERVEQADVVLEALGHATTMKNSNSSRFVSINRHSIISGIL